MYACVPRMFAVSIREPRSHVSQRDSKLADFPGPENELN